MSTGAEAGDESRATDVGWKQRVRFLVFQHGEQPCTKYNGYSRMDERLIETRIATT
jgi:hypothetical protein